MNTTDTDVRRQIIHGLLSLVLSLLAARLALYLTNKILGDPQDGRLLD